MDNQLEGYLVDEETGNLERSVDSTGWHIPEDITLQGKNLVWNLFNPNSVSGREAKKVWLKPSLLTNFIRLRNAKGSTILNFARKWGVLCLCEHGLPAWHAGGLCLPLGDHVFLSGRQFEPIEVWRKYSSEAQGILEEAAKIYRDMDEMQVIENRHEIWNRQVILAKRVQSWLDQAAVKVEYFWWQDKAKVLLGTPSLFAALSVQLMSVVSRKSLALCCNCGEIYVPSRIPRADQRNYCDKEECKKASWRDAKRDQRRNPEQSKHIKGGTK
ncbi:hypothetical protein ACFLRP_03575 [Bacteroidota bacterium]